MQSYKELVVWQKSMNLVSEIYEVTRSFPREEIYELTSQMRRSAVSVPSNIAEGQGRASKGEFIQFLCHARGSLFELETQIILAAKFDYVSREGSERLLAQLTEVARILNGLLTSLRPPNRKLSTIH
ncbi:MAG: four helix bundle protein [Candidatus Korobacteraceae bacterium]